MQHQKVMNQSMKKMTGQGSKTSILVCEHLLFIATNMFLSKCAPGGAGGVELLPLKVELQCDSDVQNDPCLQFDVSPIWLTHRM